MEDNSLFEALVKYRLERAVETLDEARIMIENQRYNAAVNRAYYACFYAVLALLIKNGIETKSHEGAKQMFGLHFIKTKKLDSDIGAHYTLMKKSRKSGDYDDFVYFTEAQARSFYTDSIHFIEVLKEECNK
ncbi:MAG: HEPN domain-containing protein [Bacteroidales bacterium]|nr:HEPN domain-containing protein [Bacteroidales bacterium]